MKLEGLIVSDTCVCVGGSLGEHWLSSLLSSVFEFLCWH